MVQLVRVLIIEDQQDLAEAAKREIEDSFVDSDEIAPEIEIATDFDEGFRKVRDGECDVVVLDVRREATDSTPENDTAGHEGYLDIKSARFIPIIFWTALPEKVVDDEMRPLVTVVAKDDTVQLPAVITAAVSTGALKTIEQIEDHVSLVLTKHMWDELAPNWAEYVAGDDSADIAQVLLTRLARILNEKREQSNAAHPSHRYIYPPASERLAPGDLFRATDHEFWVTLTPACDFAQEKVGLILIAHADPLRSHPLYKKWDEGGRNSKTAWNNLKQNVLTATRGRYHYLPEFRSIPDLVLDLENVQAVPMHELNAMNRVASLASPYAEALLVQHSHFRGRIGVPDVDVELIQECLSESGGKDSLA